MKSIINISKTVEKLPKAKKKLFNTLFSVVEDTGRLRLPDEMKPWVKKTFKSLKAVERQKIIRIDNNITYESSLFNELRASRPVVKQDEEDILKMINSKQDPFDHPLTGTPQDFFGRIKGKHSITASNIAKYDTHHDLIIFNEHNPLKFSLNDIKDYLRTAETWIRTVHARRPKRKYPYIMWNCMWKAAASMIHGHMQAVIAKERHYGNIERLRMFSEVYKDLFKKDYFSDLYKAHKAVGLGFSHKKNKIFCSLTPVKDKEVLILSNSVRQSADSIHKVLKSYKKMGVQSFNVGIYLSPLDNSWKIPIIVRIIDRGKLSTKTTDFGGMEVFAGTSVVETDPYKVFKKIKGDL